MMALASVQEARLHCLLRIVPSCRILSVLQMKTPIRTCCWTCHPIATALRRNYSYLHQVLLLKQVLVVAQCTLHISSVPNNTIILCLLPLGCWKASVKPNNMVGLHIPCKLYIWNMSRGSDDCILPICS